MYHARLVAVYVQMACTERLYLGVLVERLAEHLDAYLRSFKHVERLHYYHVHQSVAHRSLRSYICIVAILRRIGARYEERLVL